MGLLAKYREFKQKRLDKAIAKNRKLVSHAKAIREDRVAAIDFFCTLDSADIAVPALLTRFDYSLEHGINDTREKEAAMAGILSFKDKALPHIRSHLTQSDRIAWPIKAFKAIGTDEQVVEALGACLGFGEVSLDQRKVDKNYDILCYLCDYKLPRPLTERLFHFLVDLDERVRFATVETLIEQDHPDIPAQLERFLKDDSAENTRVRQSVVAAFIRRRWAIRDHSQFEPGPLMRGITINRNYQLENQA